MSFRFFPVFFDCLLRAFAFAAFCTSAAYGADGAGVSDALGKQIKPASPAVATERNLAALSTGQGRRVALVIGNGDYQHANNLPKLANPTHDAEDIAKALRHFGFEVIERKNLTLEGMSQAVAEFGSKIGGSEAALFYFAGHGIQVKNQNYLMPVSAKIESEAAVPFQGFNVNQILEEMDNGKSGANIVMLDACRNNPISGKFRSGASRGLASPGNAPQGTVIVYATDPGNVAADGEGRNGMFTAGLLTAFKGGDLSLDGVLTAASEYVEQKSLESDPTRKQTPYVNGPKTLQKHFHFRVTVEPGKGEIEKTFWSSIERSTDVADFEAYLRKYPQGSYRALAENQIKRLKTGQQAAPAAATKPAPLAVSPAPSPAVAADAETQFWYEVKASGAREYFDAYLKQYPKGKYLALARIELKKIDERDKEQRAKEAAEKQHNTERARQEVQQAEQRLWDQTKTTGTVAAYAYYLENYPQGRFAPLAEAANLKLRREVAEREKADTEKREREKQEAARLRQQEADRASALASASAARPELRWRLASSFPKSLNAVFGVADELAKSVAASTGGKFNIQVFAAGEVVPGPGVLDAVKNDTVQMGHTASQYFVGKDPAFAFDTAMPFGLSQTENKEWLSNAGGLPQLREFFRGYNIVNIPCGSSGEPLMEGWFRKEIRTVADLNGMKFRVGGFSGQVLGRLGVVPQQIPGGDIYPALERGVIDAAQWLGPYDDERLGFYKVARYYYLPLSFNSAMSFSLYINLNQWNGLPKEYQTALTMACERATSNAEAFYKEGNQAALKRMVGQGAQLRKFPEPVVRAAELAAKAHYDELAARNEGFRTLYRKWLTFKSK